MLFQRKRKQSNLAYTFVSLDRERREAMSVFYDFCRVVDDIADDPRKPDQEKSRDLSAWREEIIAGIVSASPPPWAWSLSVFLIAPIH